MKKNVLYITYDGLLQPLGQSQVLNLILELSKKEGFTYTILSFERNEDVKKPILQITEQKLQQAKVNWVRLGFTENPRGIATLWNLFKGYWAVWRILQQQKISVVHARSYVPAMLASFVKKNSDAAFLFDMRGFWVDEKADVGSISRGSFIYKILKKMETSLLQKADHVVSLSRAGIVEMQKWKALQNNLPSFSMITTCTDLAQFKLSTHKKREGLMIGYVGTATGWYSMEPFFESMQYLWKKRPEAKLLVINRYEQDLFRAKLAEYKVPAEKVEIKTVDHHQMANELARMDGSIFFIHPMYSKIASAPTKLGELLACGIPALTNAGIGDVKEILQENQVGIAIEDFEQESLEKGVDNFLAMLNDPSISERCAKTAKQLFSLEEGAHSYQKIYLDIAK